MKPGFHLLASSSLISLARGLNLKLLDQGVETQDAFQLLASVHRRDYVQGNDRKGKPL